MWPEGLYLDHAGVEDKVKLLCYRQLYVTKRATLQKQEYNRGPKIRFIIRVLTIAIIRSCCETNEFDRNWSK